MPARRMDVKANYVFITPGSAIKVRPGEGDPPPGVVCNPTRHNSRLCLGLPGPGSQSATKPRCSMHVVTRKLVSYACVG